MTIDDYLEAAPEPQCSTLRDLRSLLRELLPDAIESMSYNMPSFKEDGNAIAGYAYFKEHCSYFPHSGLVLPELADALDGYEWSKGTLRFGVDEPLPRSLVTRLVEVRREQLKLK